MNPTTYIHVFAVIAAVALCLQIFSAYWLPLGLGGLAMLLLTILLRR